MNCRKRLIKTRAERRLGTFGVALAASLLASLSTGALARDVKISGTHGVGDIEVHCGNANGTFFNTPGGGYGCVGSGGTVTCTAKGKCTGWVPRIGGQTGINAILNSTVLSGSAGGESTSNGVNYGTLTTVPNATAK
jgi:hypothetical protein